MDKPIYRGQIGLVLLVIMGVVVALVMSVASRSLSDTVLSRQERESSAAFAVAETGVENALSSLRQGSVMQGAASLSDTSGLVSGEYEVFPTSNYALYVHEGETAHLDLSSFAGSTLDIYWTKKTDTSENLGCVGEGSGNAPAGLEITAISAGSGTVERSYYNAYNCSLVGTGFLASYDGGASYRSSVTSYPVPANTAAIRVKPVYAGATVLVSGAGLSTQLYLIQSSASGGDAQKEIEVKRGLEAPPSVFDFAVFSAGTIVK